MAIRTKKICWEAEVDGGEWKGLPLDGRCFGIGFKVRLLEALK